MNPHRPTLGSHHGRGARDAALPHTPQAKAVAAASPVNDHEEDDDEIDLDAYDQYIADNVAHARQASAWPQSARPFRPYATESPQFYMVNANNPSAPIDDPTTDAGAQPVVVDVAALGPRGRPKRPMSARPSFSAGVRVPKAPSSARPSSGLRRRRQEDVAADDTISARVRAVYCDVGRRGASIKSLAPSATTASLLSSRARLVPLPSEQIQDDYLKLTDVVTSLRAALRHEQAARLKAMARVRRLEEIVTMKDRKIEALMQGNAVTATAATVAAMRDDTGKFGYAAAAAFAQRELAQRDRQHHVLVQKLRQRLAEQTQLLATYESEMQTLRCSLKSAALMQLETECEELHLEIQRLQNAMVSQQHELTVQVQHTRDAIDAGARVQQQLARALEDHKRLVHDKRRLEQEVVLLRAHVDELERRVVLEQRKRSYDQGFHTGTRGPKSPRSPSTTTTVTSLAEALAEMRSAPKASSDRPLSARRPTPALPHPPATSERSSRPAYARRRSVGEAVAGGSALDVLAEETLKEEQEEQEKSPRHIERASSASSVATASTESTRRSSASTTADSSSASSTSASTASLPSVEAPQELSAAIDAAAAAMTKELQALGLLDCQESWLNNTELEDGDGEENEEEEEEDEEEGADDGGTNGSKVAYELDFMDT